MTQWSNVLRGVCMTMCCSTGYIAGICADGKAIECYAAESYEGLTENCRLVDRIAVTLSDDETALIGSIAADLKWKNKDFGNHRLEKGVFVKPGNDTYYYIDKRRVEVSSTMERYNLPKSLLGQVNQLITRVHEASAQMERYMTYDSLNVIRTEVFRNPCMFNPRRKEVSVGFLMAAENDTFSIFYNVAKGRKSDIYITRYIPLCRNDNEPSDDETGNDPDALSIITEIIPDWPALTVRERMQVLDRLHVNETTDNISLKGASSENE